MEFDTVLRNTGLGGNESRVYLAALALGESTASAIALESKLQRSIVYRYLQSLCAKGLVASVEKNGVAHYAAAHPNQLLNLLAEKQLEIEHAIPRLEAIHKASAKPISLALIEGWDGVKLVFNESLKLPRGQEVCAIAYNVDYLAEFGDYFDRLNKLRNKRGVKFRVVYGKSPQAKARVEFQNKLRTTRYRIYSKDIPGAALTLLFPNYACLIDFNGSAPAGIIIRNQGVLLALREQFEAAWRQSK